MKYVFGVLLLLLPSFLQAQTGSEQVVAAVSDRERPRYPGGDNELKKYLSLNLRYPNAALQEKIQGEVQVSFVIDEEGRISNVKTVKGIGFGCDEEAERVIKAMPPWKPGHRNGKEIRVRYILPVVFELPVDTTSSGE